MMKKHILIPLLSIFLFIIILIPYIQTSNFDFINYDDPSYVYETSEVTNGCVWAAVRWAFTDTVKTTSNWHPVTFLSLMLDVQFFGVTPGAMHLHNAVLHAINSVLLFYFLTVVLMQFGRQKELFGEKIQFNPILDDREKALLLATFIAAFFWGIHPLRVESVAWISSRKDVLSLFCFLIGMVTHLNWSKHQDLRMLIPMIFYALAFMSKPTAIVFTPIILLLDYTLFQTIRWKDMGSYIIMMLVFAAVTVSAQNAVITTAIPFTTRLMNAVASIGIYFQQTGLPTNLTLFYPYDEPVPLKAIAKGVFVFVVLAILMMDKLILFIKQNPLFSFSSFFGTIALDQSAKRKTMFESVIICGPDFPLFLLGIGWFFIALLPVIGIIHVGIAAHADRYTYLAGIGFSVCLAVILYRLFSTQNSLRRRAILFGAFVILMALGFITNRQVTYWQNTITVFKHAQSVTDENHVAHCNLAAEYFRLEDYEQAFIHCRLLAAQGYPEMAMPRMEFLMNYLAGGTPTNQVDFLLLKIDEKNDPLASYKYHALGMIAFNRKLYASAESFARQSIALNKVDGYVWELLSAALYKQGDADNALGAMQQAKKLLPKRQTINQGISIITEELRKKN